MSGRTKPRGTKELSVVSASVEGPAVGANAVDRDGRGINVVLGDTVGNETGLNVVGVASKLGVV